MDLIKYVQQQVARDISDFDFFKPGDNIAVSYKIVEGDKERTQVFRGDVIQINGEGATKTFTIRKISNGVGVERIFPFNCPSIIGITNLKKAKVRRARLYYLRTNSKRIKEKRFTNPVDETRKGKKRKLAWSWDVEQKPYK